MNKRSPDATSFNVDASFVGSPTLVPGKFGVIYIIFK